MDIYSYGWIVCMQVATENGFEANQLHQPLIGAEQHKCAIQKTICNFFALGVPKSNQRAIDAFRGLDFRSYSVDDSNLNRHYSWCMPPIFVCMILYFVFTSHP